MSISKFNSEGYYDPTAYEALTAVEQSEKARNTFRPMVYICSPYSGDIESNTLAARRYSRFAADRGYIPIAPHLLFTQFFDDILPAERELGLFFGNVLMSKCAEVWVFGTYISCGMEAEIDRAKRRNYNIRYSNTNCEEVQNVRDQK
ncbi:MAG: hypothetical protein K0M69_16525 [Youngiibacter sp.]|jgi:hypothetical protein|nr:hypothetical protein [Youngiibacter sp.]